MKRITDLLELGGIKKEISVLVISGLALVFSFFDLVPLPFDVAWIAIILCGTPIILEAIIGLITKFDIKADVLVSLALIAAVIIGEDFAAGEVAFIMQLGALLEDLTVLKAREGIEKLVQLTPRVARRIVDSNEEVVQAEFVLVGDILRVLPGETVPVDGVIISGDTSLNQAVMTGESLPIDKSVGDGVSSGTVNQFGSFDMLAVKVGEDSSIQRMIRLVQSADASKAKIVGIADRWATWIVVIALGSAFMTWLVTGEVIRAVTILVVFCPCALVLATPTAIMAGIGNATKHGFLVREGDALERLSSVDTVSFDKTGTMTHGLLRVVAIQSVSSELTEEDVYYYAACAETRSEHPIGKAVVRSYQHFFQRDFEIADDFTMIPGRGIIASLNGKKIIAGNLKMLEENAIDYKSQVLNIADQYLNEGCTIIYLAIDTEIKGFLALADTLRIEASDMMRELVMMGITPILMTGDHLNAAEHIAEQLHIQTIHANCLPEDKLAIIDGLQFNNTQVCMIGDGINDAPALKKAYVGIAMGGIGSDIAVEAADIVLIDDEIKELPHLFKMAKRMMVTIKYNLAFSMILNFVAIVLAMTGILNPIMGALVHNAGSMVVIINSALMLNWRSKGHIEGDITTKIELAADSI